MKKIITLVASMLAIALSVNAQFFVGGNLGVEVAYAKDGLFENTDWAIDVSPTLGYEINEKFLVGVEFEVGGGSVSKMQTFTWAVAPYFRYSFLHFSGLALGAELSVGAVGMDPEGGNNAMVGAEVSLYPVISYAINEHLILESKLSLLSFGYQYLDFADLELNKLSDGYHSVGFGVNRGEVASLGVIYKF